MPRRKTFPADLNAVSATADKLLFGFPVKETEQPIVLFGMQIVFSNEWPSPTIIGDQNPISGLPARTQDGRFVVEGGHWMQISLPLIGLRYAAFAMGCLWAERHNGILSRFPVTAVWTPDQWEAANADPDFSLAAHLLARASDEWAKFQSRSEQTNTDA